MPVDDPSPYFFLAYAHTPERPWVVQLYKDLCAEVLERTDFPIGAPIGFMDSGIAPGRDWRDEVGRGLATCRVFVPLYSPRYFTREECGIEWHAWVQRQLDHRARHPGAPSAIVPAIWLPVGYEDLPEVARRVQMDHADLGREYVEEGLYTLIKNSWFRKQYVTAVQRLAQHIIRTAKASALPPCDVRHLTLEHNAFANPGRRPHADRHLVVIAAAPTVDRLPSGCSADFYGRSSVDWNPFFPASRQSIADYAADVARSHGYVTTVLPFEEGCDFMERRTPADGLGVLLVDPWSAMDSRMAQRLQRLDALDVDWVGTMVTWNQADPPGEKNQEIRDRLRELLPRRFGAARPVSGLHATSIHSLEDFRVRLPLVVSQAVQRYVVHANAHPPVGVLPPLPQLTGRTTAEDRSMGEESRGRA